MSSGGNITFFTTAAHPCSYLPDHQAVTLFADPEAAMTPQIYSQLSDLGFRRSGSYVYRPQCRACTACISVRIPVEKFKPRREQRRCWQRNQDIQVHTVAVGWSEEHYRLYARYINARHRDGDMFPPSPRQYREFLTSSWSDTELIEFRLNGELIAVAVTDTLADGLSAVYTYYDPDMPARSLGSFAILWQIELCRSRALSSLYLGYWVRQSQRMRYKTQFRPLELLVENKWLLAQ